MKLFTILVFAIASLFNFGVLDARYKIDINVEGGLEGCIYFHFSTISKSYHFNYLSTIILRILSIMPIFLI